MTIHKVMRHIRSSLWFVPVVCVLGGAVLSFLTIAIDRALDYSIVPESLTGGPDAALAVLTTVAASMVTLLALVLTITMVVVQLAMGQFSPRIVQTFLQDKPSQFAIGLFVATFAHAMLAMREVRFGPPEVVPGLAIVVAYALIVISIVVLVLYVHHIGQSLRVSALLELVGTDTRELMDDLYPESATSSHHDASVVPADHSGVVNEFEAEEIVALARSNDVRLQMVPLIGHFVPAGSTLFQASGPVSDEAGRQLRSQVMLGPERTLDRDMAYGFRMLVDMAERAIAESSFLDPTTSVQAIDRLHDCLRQLAPRVFPSGTWRDEDGVVRLSVPQRDWDDYVHLAFDELILAGRQSPPVARRIREALLDLRTVAPTERVPILDQLLDELSEDGSPPSTASDDIDDQRLQVGSGESERRDATKAAVTP